MKSSAFFILFLSLANLFLTSCATVQPDIVSKTVYSDIFPQNLTRSQYYEHLGQDYFIQEQYVNAIEMFRLSILHSPANDKARFSLAKSYVKTQQSHLALIELEKYFVSHPNFSGVTDNEMQLVSEIYEASNSFEKLIEIQKNYFEKSKSPWALWKIFENQTHQGHWNDSLTTLNQLSEINSESSVLYKINLARADVYMHLNKLNEAVVSLTAAEKNKPLDEFAMHKKIEVLYLAKNWAQINDEGFKYTKYHPFNVDISDKWSYSAIQIGEYDTALQELKKQKKVVPDLIGLDFKIAHVLFLMKDYPNAEMAYKDLYETTGSDQTVYYLAQIHMINGKYDAATDSLQQLISTSEYYPQAQIQMARLEWKNNQRDLALNRLRSAHMLRPDYLDLYLEYAQYLIWTKNYVEALALLEKAHLYHNKSDQLRLLTAYSHFKLNNQKKFSQDIKEAIALNPQNAEIYAVLSELWYEKRKPASEIQFLTEKAIALNSENKNVKPLLAWSLLQQDQLTQAVALFEEFYDQNPTEVFYSESLADIYARNTLPIKTLDYQDKVVELKMQNQLKNEIDYFSNQNQVQKTDSQNVKSRLPASLDQ